MRMTTITMGTITMATMDITTTMAITMIPSGATSAMDQGAKYVTPAMDMAKCSATYARARGS